MAFAAMTKFMQAAPKPKDVKAVKAAKAPVTSKLWRKAMTAMKAEVSDKSKIDWKQHLVKLEADNSRLAILIQVVKQIVK